MSIKKFHTVDFSSLRFLVTGGAGFIGSHLVEYLLFHGAAKVIVLDNLSTGNENNIALFEKYPAYEFVSGDIRDAVVCDRVCQQVDYVLHEAALGSVPRSVEDPMTTHQVNVDGFVNVLDAAKRANVKRMVYASSSSVYGDHPILPKVEAETGNLLSPYAVTKKINELYADVYARNYPFKVIGLRYFNIFGARQSPAGAYAALIPRFLDALLTGKSPVIYGDGEQGRDFTYIENAVQANIKALFAPWKGKHCVYNIAAGTRTTVNDLWAKLQTVSNCKTKANYEGPRPGDIRDSLADITAAQNDLGYQPEISVDEGLRFTLAWFEKQYI